MGTTATSIHVLRPAGSAPSDLVKPIGKAIEKLGYRPAKTSAAEADKRVALCIDEAARFVSLYDAANGRLDSGELRELAALVSRALKTAVLHTSIYDGDRFELAVYAKGRCIDVVASGDGAQEAPAEAGTPKKRRSLWRRVLHGFGTHDGFAGSPFGSVHAGREQSFTAAFAQAADADGANAEDGLSLWCQAAGLDAGAAMALYEDAPGTQIRHELRFVHDAARRRVPKPPAAEVRLVDTTDEDERPEHDLFPAAWPTWPGEAHRMRWFAVSEGAGFDAVRVHLGVPADSGYSVERVALYAEPFHQGQIMGDTIASFEWDALETGRPIDPRGPIDIPSFRVPAPAQGSRARFIVRLPIAVRGPAGADAVIRPTLEVTSPVSVVHSFTPLRVRAIAPAWQPRALKEIPRRRSGTRGDPVIPREEEQRDALLLLNAPGIVHGCAVLAAAGEPLGAVRDLAAAIVAACRRSDVAITVSTETQMTMSGNTSRTKRVVTGDFDADASIERMFSAAAAYQNAAIDITLEGYAAPVAGVFYAQPVEGLTQLPREDFAVHAFAWCIDDPGVSAGLGWNAAWLTDRFAAWLASRTPMQAWVANCAWRPHPASPDDARPTPYETVAGPTRSALTATWCRRYLRMVSPRLWLGDDLMANVDRGRVEEVAETTRSGAVTHLHLRSGRTLADLEAALETVLPRAQA